MAAIFDFRHTRTSDSLRTSLPVLPDPENTGVAVELSLRSCVRAQKYVIPCLLLVNVRHLWFPTYTDVGQYSDLSLRVARPRKYGYSRWMFAILYISWYIRYFLSTSGLWPPSLISDIPGRQTVFPSVFSYCPTPKTWVSTFECLFAILYTSWDTRYVICTAGLWPLSSISDIPGRQTVSLLVSPCCLTPKT